MELNMDKKVYDYIRDHINKMTDLRHYNYEFFLRKCLEPYGITQSNAGEYIHRIRIDVEFPYNLNSSLIKRQYVYMDGKYLFTINTIINEVTVDDAEYRIQYAYEKIVEEDKLQ